MKQCSPLQRTTSTLTSLSLSLLPSHARPKVYWEVAYLMEPATMLGTVFGAIFQQVSPFRVAALNRLLRRQAARSP